MKKQLITILFLISVPNLFSFSGGTGTESDPYLISNADDWLTFADSVNYEYLGARYWSRYKYFKLTANIIIPDVRIFRFYGYFDGDGYKLTVSIIGSGLFSVIDRIGIVERLRVDGTVSSSLDGVGSIAGVNHGIIRNCINYAELSCYAGYIGGIAGENNNTINDCINYGNVSTPTDGAGGISGDERGTINRCINVGNVTANQIVAGIAASITGRSSVSISNSINMGNITGNGSVGGILGIVSLDYVTTLTNCINVGYIKGNQYVGGIYGRLIYNPTLGESVNINCINIGVVEGNVNVGAMAGRTDSEEKLIFINCHYDKQFCIHKGVNGQDFPGVSGHITRNMVGRKLASLLGDADWTYVEGATLIECLYPQLKVFSESPDEKRTDASKAGATPIFLYDGIKD